MRMISVLLSLSPKVYTLRKGFFMRYYLWTLHKDMKIVIKKLNNSLENDFELNFR